MLQIAEPELKLKASSASKSASPSHDIERQRMLRWLDRMVDDGKRGVVTDVVTLTPVLASILLDRNEANRKLSDLTVDSYRRDILAGRWAFNGQAIIISKEGMMNDGQHRCSAVASSGCMIQTVIVFGVERETRLTVDQGRVRTSGDYVGMNGVPDANVTAAIAGFIWQAREKGRISQQASDRPTKSEVLFTVQHYQDIHESIVVAGKKGAGLVGGKSTLGFCHWWISRKCPSADVSLFIERLIEGDDLKKGDPILTARNRLLSKERMIVNERVELVIRAWNAHRRGERPKSLVVLNGQLPKVVR